jgi:hypothetical protein
MKRRLFPLVLLSFLCAGQVTAAVVSDENQAEFVKLVNSKPWSPEIKRAVLERKVLKRMTPEQVTMAWGKPQTVSRVVSLRSTSEEWAYDRNYLYFLNGELTSFRRADEKFSGIRDARKRD